MTKRLRLGRAGQVLAVLLHHLWFPATRPVRIDSPVSLRRLCDAPETKGEGKLSVTA